MKKPGSISAIYLLSGILDPASLTSSVPNLREDGEDTCMQSSPFMSSSMPQGEDEEEPQAVKSIIMCREEDLEGRSPMLVFDC